MDPKHSGPNPNQVVGLLLHSKANPIIPESKIHAKETSIILKKKLDDTGLRTFGPNLPLLIKENEKCPTNVQPICDVEEEIILGEVSTQSQFLKIQSINVIQPKDLVVSFNLAMEEDLYASAKEAKTTSDIVKVNHLLLKGPENIPPPPPTDVIMGNGGKKDRSKEILK